MKRLLQRQWQTGGWLSALLSPLSWLTALAVRLKRTAYRRGWRRATRIDVPVIVVGNIYVGGTGKTPFILALIAELQARGWHPGVVSRGYGVDVGAEARVGQGKLDADRFGDEPALIARSSGVPVAVHPRRALAAQALRLGYPEVDVVLADDGLQHLALARDIDIVVQDSRAIGNGRLLPAGPLREPAFRLHEVDALVTNLTGQPSLPPDQAGDTRVRRLTMRLQAGDAYRVTDGSRRPLREAATGRIAAAAGIGHPERFFSTLLEAGVQPILTLSLPDHYDYATSPFSAVDADCILVTTKDAVKCEHLDDPRIWAVTVSAHLSDPYFIDWLETRLHGRTPARNPGLPD